LVCDEKRRSKNMKNKGEIPSFKNGKMPSILLYIIIIAITLAAIAVTIFLGKKNYRETIRLATEQFNRQQLILARSVAKGIETFIADVNDDLLMLSNFSVVQRRLCRGWRQGYLIGWKSCIRGFHRKHHHAGWTKTASSGSYTQTRGGGKI
jgi:hypothetical protein